MYVRMCDQAHTNLLSHHPLLLLLLPSPPFPSAQSITSGSGWQTLKCSEKWQLNTSMNTHTHAHTISYTLITHSVHTYVCNKQYVPVHLCSSVAVLLMEPRPPCPLLLPLLPSGCSPSPSPPTCSANKRCTLH